MQILSLVVYSLEGAINRIDFKPGVTNIITGRRSTGKTALTRVIEYCFGSSNPVPGSVIRNSVSWYGLLLQMQDGTRTFVARREPGPEAQTSTDIYINAGADVDIAPYADLEQNINTENLRAFLGERLGLPYVEAEMRPASSRSPYRINLSHAMLFNLLREDELIKANQLFHRQDEPHMANVIRDVLPFFVGAMNESRIPLARELDSERRNLRILLKEAPGPQSADTDSQTAKAIELLEEARAQGILGQAAGDPISLLGSIDIESEPTAHFEDLVGKIDSLRVERDRLLESQRRLRTRISAIQSLRHSEAGLVGELDTQRARLTSIGLLNADVTDESHCPICRQSIETVTPSAQTLHVALARVEKQLATMDASRPQLDVALDDLEKRRAEIADKLRENQASLNALEREQMRLEQNRPSLLAAERTKGRIQMFLETRSVVESEGQAIASRIERSRARIKELEEQLSWEEIDQQMASMVALIDRDITTYAQKLNLAHSDSVRLDYRGLTIIANTENGALRLNHMGGGANAVGYHLATYSALHKWFRTKHRPVPNFILFDQPTMPYYVNDPELRLPDDDDREQVNRMFRFLIDYPKSTGVQIIVTDHAVLTEVSGFKEAIVADWHAAGTGLVPPSWPRRQNAFYEEEVRSEEAPGEGDSLDF